MKIIRFVKRWNYWLPVWIGAVLAIENPGIVYGQSLAAQFQQDTPYREHYRRGEYPQALEILQKEIDARPELGAVRAFRYIYWLSDRALILLAMGRVDEAIDDLKICAGEYPEPVFFLRLALLYRERGRMEDSRAALDFALRERQSRWAYHPYEENILAVARIAELRGENPKQLLSSIYTSLMENLPNFSGGFTGAGDLAFRRGAYDLADSYYRQALAVNEADWEALAGLAETYWKAGDSRLEEILVRLLQLDPNHFRAKAIEAELFLDRGEAQEALELLKAPLAINPHQLRLRSLQAAACFLLDATEEMRRIRREVLEFNPACSEVDRIPGRIASRHYRFREGIEFQQKALKTDPGDVESRTQYGLDLLRIGEEEEGRRALELAFAADPYNVQVFNLLNLLDTLETFETVRDDSFVVRFPPKEYSVWSDEALVLLKDALETYRSRYHIELHTPIHVQIFDDHDDFMVRSVGLPGAVAFMGICFGQLITMDSPSARSRLTMNWRSVLWHEFVHVITLQKTNHRMPRWLSEGISVFEETCQSPSWGQKMKPAYKGLIENEELPGVSDMERYFVQPKTSGHLMLGYFLAGEFVRYYVETFRIEPLVAALEAMGQGKEAVSALADSAGRTVTELDGGFKLYLENRLSPFRNLPLLEMESGRVNPDRNVGIDAIAPASSWLDRPSPFTDALREGEKALERENWIEAETAFEKAFQLFPDYTGENAPLLQLTRLYQRWGNKDKLMETLWRRVEWDSLDFEACQKLMAIHQEDHDWERTVLAARRALSIDPFHVDTRQIIQNALAEMNQFDAAMREIEKLIRLDPHRKIDYRLERIRLLRRLNERERARREVLLLLEQYPHLWKAQEILLSIAEGESTND